MKKKVKCPLRYTYLGDVVQIKCLIDHRVCNKVKKCIMKNLVYIAAELDEWLLDNETYHITNCLERIGKIEFE